MSLLLNAVFHHSLMMIPQQEIPGKKLGFLSVNNFEMKIMQKKMTNLSEFFDPQEQCQLLMLCKITVSFVSTSMS